MLDPRDNPDSAAAGAPPTAAEGPGPVVETPPVRGRPQVAGRRRTDPQLPLAGGPPDRALWWTQVTILGVSLGILLLAAIMSIENGQRVRLPGLPLAIPETCQFKQLWGLPCPGCGLTRCFISMAHLDLRAAWHYHPAGTLFFGMLMFQLPFRSYQLQRLRRRQPPVYLGSWPVYLLGLLAGWMLLQWTVRLAQQMLV